MNIGAGRLSKIDLAGWHMVHKVCGFDPEVAAMFEMAAAVVFIAVCINLILADIAMIVYTWLSQK